jgi:tRNA wybutosine-synthesizing protein 1
VDDAKTVIDGATQNHLQMIKQLRGIPGLKQERFEEALNIKHCALSLVGEPIMVPLLDHLFCIPLSMLLVSSHQRVC